MPAPPTIASGAIRKFLDGLTALALDPAEVCAAAGTSPDVATDPDARVDVEVLYRLWEALLARHARPDLAIDGARRYVPGDYGLVGFVCASAPTLGAALAQVARYARLWTDTPTMTVVDRGVVELRDRPPQPDRPGRRLTTEAALAELVQGARVVSGRPDLVPAAVEIEHPAPPDVASHRAFFGVEPRFGAGRSAVAFAPELVDLPLPGADPRLGAFLDGLARGALARRGEPEDLLARVRACVAEALPHGVPDVVAVAKKLATSERTLRRRLEAEGTGFRDVVDATRAELARAYVADARLPLSEVAFLLGYAEQSAFQRAFKRWTGTTPAAWRARAR